MRGLSKNNEWKARKVFGRVSEKKGRVDFGVREGGEGGKGGSEEER